MTLLVRFDVGLLVGVPGFEDLGLMLVVGVCVRDVLGVGGADVEELGVMLVVAVGVGDVICIGAAFVS